MCEFGMESFPGKGLRKTEINTAVYIIEEFAIGRLNVCFKLFLLGGTSEISDLFCGKNSTCNE